jgi:predicted RNase H-like HicB family nuclease
MRFAVVLHKDKGSVYGVTVPDVPGCFSAGDTVEDALDNAREAIYAHLELLAQDGEPVPDDVGIDIERLRKEKDFADGIFAVVEVNIDDITGPAERINLTIPRRALAKIDAAAKSLHDSRSGLMTKATINYIAGLVPANLAATPSTARKTSRTGRGKRQLAPAARATSKRQ